MVDKNKTLKRGIELKKIIITTAISCGIGYAFYKIPTLIADKIYYYNSKNKPTKR